MENSNFFLELLSKREVLYFMGAMAVVIALGKHDDHRH